MLDGRHFGTGVHAAADITFLLELGMGIGLLVGAVLARKEKFRLHAWCQSAAILLNFMLICFLMLPPFWEQIFPKIPSGLGKSYYSIATLHAVFGSLAEVSGLYIVLAA